ncbi:MAG: hypothetical protein SGARI_001163 [Bacillariaceae sp.]
MMMKAKQQDDAFGSSANNGAAAGHQKNPDVHVIAPSSNGNESDGANQNKSMSTNGDKMTDKRFLPSYKKPDAALTFPEKMMSLMKFATKAGDPETFCVAWLDDGKSFIVRQPDEFTRKVLPKFFKATKFSSFTRKLYRWGFRQVNRGIGPDDPIIFGNEYFQRDNAELMAKMRSTTAASTRKQEEDNLQKMLTEKRMLDSMQVEQQQKRMLFNTLMQQNAMQMSLGGAFQPNSISSSSTNDSNNGLNPNSLLMQSLQQNSQQPILFGGGNMNGQMMNFGNNLSSMNQSMNNNASNNNVSDSTSNNNGMSMSMNNMAMSGLKPFEIFAAQQQQNGNGGTNSGNFNPLLNFQLPTSNNGSSLMNSMAMNGSMNSMGIGSSMNGGGNTNNNHDGNNSQNPSSTAEIVNAAIHALKGAP